MDASPKASKVIASTHQSTTLDRRPPALTTWQFAQRLAGETVDMAPERWENIFKVLDGFRAYVLNPAHYRQQRVPTLVIPHFGIFRLLDRPAKSGVVPFSGHRFATPVGYRLRFRLSPQANADHFDSHSRQWVDKAEGRGMRDLSVQRRIAVAVSEEMDAELGLVDFVLTAMYRHIINLLTGKGQAFTYYKLGKFLPVTGRGSFKASTHALQVLADVRANNE